MKDILLWRRRGNWATRMSGPTILFAFDHKRDSVRAKVIVEHWRFSGTIEDTGLVSEAEWAAVAKKGEAGIRKHFDAQMRRSCVTVVLIGRETAINPWVRYQIQKSYQRGNAIIGIYVHNIRLFEEVEQEKGSLYFGAFGMGGKSEGAYFSQFAKIYDWRDDDGPSELANWIEVARAQSGRSSPGAIEWLRA
jgi:hypothetical protein